MVRRASKRGGLFLCPIKKMQKVAQCRKLHYHCPMWREGYDYPADDEDEGRDYYEEADEQHDKQQDQTLDQ